MGRESYVRVLHITFFFLLPFACFGSGVLRCSDTLSPARMYMIPENPKRRITARDVILHK
jgi:hypothetical protein